MDDCYPKYVFGQDGQRLVKNAKEFKELKGQWFDHPNEVPKEEEKGKK